MSGPEPPTAGRHREPTVAIVAGVFVGILMATAHHPQAGMFVVAGSFGVAAVLRLVLRAQAAGLLVVRNRRIDVGVLAALAAAIAVLAAVTPFPSGR